MVSVISTSQVISNLMKHPVFMQPKKNYEKIFFFLMWQKHKYAMHNKPTLCFLSIVIKSMKFENIQYYITLWDMHYAIKNVADP